MSVQPCKGMQDFSLDEMRRFRFIEGVFRECCLKWGYDEVRTPTLEYLHLFTSAGTLTPSRLGISYVCDGCGRSRQSVSITNVIAAANRIYQAPRMLDKSNVFSLTNLDNRMRKH